MATRGACARAGGRGPLKEKTMTVDQVLLKARHKFPTSLTSLMITIVLAVAGILFTILLAEKHSQLYYDIQASTSVLDIKEELPKLEVLFDGIDIRQQNLSLRVISVKIGNDGSKAILKGDYDSEDPVGLMVSPGRIIKTDLIDASNDYLRKNMSFRNYGENIVLFNDVILNAHQYYIIKLLVLHQVDQMPSVKPVGYMAGMETIKVREIYKEIERASIWSWSRSLAGPWPVQITRVVGYLLLFSALVIIASFISVIREGIGKAKRKKNVRRFRAVSQQVFEIKDEFLFSRYIEAGFNELMIILQIVQDERTLKQYLERAELARRSNELYLYSRVAHRAKTVDLEFSILAFIDELIKNELIMTTADGPSVDSHMKETLLNFLAFLKEQHLVAKKELGDGRFIISEKLPL